MNRCSQRIEVPTVSPRVHRIFMTASSHRWGDAGFMGLALAQGIVVLAVPSVWVLAIGLWWNANTISHNFIHRPFPSAFKRVFSVYLSLLLGVPQELWKHRHLAHHAGIPWRWKMSAQLLIEAAALVGLWST